MVYHVHTAFSLWTIDLKDYNTFLGAGTVQQIIASAKSLTDLSVTRSQFLGIFKIVLKSTKSK